MEQISNLRDCVRSVSSTDGLVILEQCQYKAELMSITVDKALLDPVYNNVGSANLNYKDGPTLLGGHDGKTIPTDLISMDGNFTKNWEHWSESQQWSKARAHNYSHFSDMCAAEGWSSKWKIHKWNPVSYKFNPITHAKVDPSHCISTLLEVMISNICKTTPNWSDVHRDMMTYLEFWGKHNNVTIPEHMHSDIEGKGKLNFTNNLKKSVLFYVGFAQICPENPRIHCVGLLLEIYSDLFQCRTGFDVLEIQKKIRVYYQNSMKTFENDPETLMRSKNRMMYVLGFWQVSLWRNQGLLDCMDMERFHQNGKHIFNRHWNNKDNSLKKMTDRQRIIWGWEYMLAGGVCGPNLTCQLSVEIRMMTDPSDPTKRFFGTRNETGLFTNLRPELRCDQERGYEFDDESLDDFVEDDWKIWNLNKLLKHFQFIGEWDDFTDLVLDERSDYTISKIRKARISDAENSVSWQLNDQKPVNQLLIGEFDSKLPFLLEVEEGVKLIKKKTGNRWIDVSKEKDRERVFVGFWGKVWTLTDTPKLNEEKYTLKKSLTYNFHYRDAGKREGGDFIGYRWIPASAIRRPASSNLFNC